ncbi:MAG: SGNH/GDSL hydrolase family protein, partial [Catenulispora sp.]|nr:SGNH/GDSL hydrolase family protein [Catenulispora sp.]
QIEDDLNFGADKTMLWLGDSITAAGTGPTVKTNQYDWRIWNYHKDKGRNVRMVNLSVSGSTSSQFERLRLRGHWDQPQVDHVYYSLGANDASQAVPTATYKANVASAIAWKKARYPNATMTVFGMTPQENNTNEANAAAMRTAASDAVTEAADPKVKFLNLGSAFDRTNTANYASSDAAGNHIHPSDAGHSGIWAVLQPWLDANPVLA